MLAYVLLFHNFINKILNCHVLNLSNNVLKNLNKVEQSVGETSLK